MNNFKLILNVLKNKRRDYMILIRSVSGYTNIWLIQIIGYFKWDALNPQHVIVDLLRKT